MALGTTQAGYQEGFQPTGQGSTRLGLLRKMPPVFGWQVVVVVIVVVAETMVVIEV